ncbi:MAG: peptidylprolyl isomerase [candidate division Zixibacteria bacterium]
MIRKLIAIALPVILLTGISFAEEETEKGVEKTEKNPIVKIETNHGDIYFEVFLNETPIHATNFLLKVDEKKYDGVSIHRVAKGFVIQGGDPTGKGNGSMGPERLADEKSPYPQLTGTVAMARSGAGASNCQFYINLQDNTRLDGMNFSSFAKVIHGMDVVNKIGLVETAGPRKETPVEPVIMTKLSRVEELPKAE